MELPPSSVLLEQMTAAEEEEDKYFKHASARCVPFFVAVRNPREVGAHAKTSWMKSDLGSNLLHVRVRSEVILSRVHALTSAAISLTNDFDGSGTSKMS